VWEQGCDLQGSEFRVTQMSASGTQQHVFMWLSQGTFPFSSLSHA
jgi:hypothetical protein